MKDRYDAVVVGGGVVGCATAWHLAERGLDVVLFEGDSIGSGCSGMATGLLGILTTEVKSRDEVRLCTAAYKHLVDLVPHLEELSGIELGLTGRPTLRVAVDDREQELLRDALQLVDGLLDAQWVGGEEARSVEPLLSDVVQGAIHEEATGLLDSYRLTLAYARAAELAGVSFRQLPVDELVVAGDRVRGVRHTAGTTSGDCVVLAAGHGVTELVAPHAPDVPAVMPIRGERLLVRPDPTAMPSTIVTAPNHGHVVALEDGLASVGSTGSRADGDWAPSDPSDTQPTNAALLQIMERVVTMMPSVANAEITQQIVGFRPGTGDGLPLIGEVPGVAGAWLATGHGTKGILVGPYTGELVARAISGEDVDGLAPWAPTRERLSIRRR